MIQNISFPEVYVVDASAGSGKTYALAKRYLQLLINPNLKPDEIPIKNILAITFTNKATIEMKDRILLLLKKLALDYFPTKEEQEIKNDIMSSLKVDTVTAQKKAYTIVDYIIRNYNFFQIKTIDSFVNSLISSCVFKLDISTNFEIKTKYDDYLMYCLDDAISQGIKDTEIQKLFKTFLVQYLQIDERKSWFPKENIYSAANILFKISNTYGNEFQKYKKDLLEVQIKKAQIFDLIKTLKNNLPEGTNGTFVNQITEFVDNGDKRFNIKSIPTKFKQDDYPLNKGYTLPREIKVLWKKIKTEIEELCEQESLSAFNTYIDIYNLISKSIQTNSKKDDVLFLEELNKQVKTLFDVFSLTIPELYYRIATRIKHYLIDEFQDTNVLQWKNLFPMVEEALSTGGTLFYVGDKKQAIYSFRGGEATLFDSVKSQVGQFNLKTEILKKNFRSQKNIIDFNNKIFACDNLKNFIKNISEVDLTEVLDIYTNVEQEHKPTADYGYVKGEFVKVESKAECENITKQKLIDIIKNLITRKYLFDDIAILTRRNDEVKLITEWLLEEGFQVESEITLNIRENAYIKEIVSLLKFLNSNSDNLSFASFILGNIFLTSSKVNKEEVQNFIFETMNNKKNVSIILYEEFKKSFADVWKKYLEQFYSNAGLIPLYDLVISIMNKYNVLNNYAEQQGFFMKLLELIKNQENETYSIDDFIKYFESAPEEDLYINVTGRESIKVLTIHKAKGLEFDVVILPFLAMDIKVGEGDSLTSKFVVRFNNEKTLLLKLNKDYNEYSQKLRDLYNEEYKKSFINELNNVYVALTRAKEELYFFVPSKIANKNNIVQLLIPWENNTIEFGQPMISKKIKKVPQLKKLPLSIYQDWLTVLKEEFKEKSDLTNRKEILKGLLLHKAISYINNLKNKDIESELDNISKKIVVEFPGIIKYEELYKILKQLCETQELKKFFFLDDGVVFQEKEIINSFGNTKRIDRMILKDNEVWVIDFKSSTEEKNKHQEQVKEYVDMIKEIYPKKNVSGYLLYLDTFIIEEV